MAAWPPELPALKTDMGITDERDDVALQTMLDAAVAFVQRVRAGQRIGRVDFDGRVNANTADAAALETLPGVDADLAQTIIDGRSYFTFAQLADRVGYDVYTAEFEADVTLAQPPDDDLVLGTLRLAGRWYTRRRAPDDVINSGELGISRVPGLDSDITRLLRIGRHAPMAVA